MNFKLKRLFGFVVLAFTMLALPSLSFADLVIQDGDININVLPENPEPYQDVTIEISSYVTDLNKATIEWKNGQTTLLYGIGKTKYSFKASGPNTTNTIDIKISPSEGGGSFTKRVSISPSEIEIMWEAVDGYTPPFYKGKSFVSPGGMIRAVAMRNTMTKNDQITYTWKNDDEVVQDASGYNKNSYTFRNKTINSTENIEVSSSSVDGSYNAVKSIEIPIAYPKIIFYKKSPTEGTLYNDALGSETYLPENEMTIVAEPYFLALLGNENLFDYTWKINGQKIDTPSKKTELTVRPTDRDGYATINLLMENFNALYQTVNAQLKINL